MSSYLLQRPKLKHTLSDQIWQTVVRLEGSPFCILISAFSDSQEEVNHILYVNVSFLNFISEKTDCSTLYKGHEPRLSFLLGIIQSEDETEHHKITNLLEKKRHLLY